LTGKKSAHRAAPVPLVGSSGIIDPVRLTRQVDTDHGRGLGQTVAFKVGAAETFLPGIGKALRGLLRTCDDILERGQLLRGHPLQVGLEEGRRANENGGRLGINGIGDFFYFQWRRQCHDRAPAQERIPERDGKAEAMKNRKVRQNPFRGREQPGRIDLRAVAQNIAVRQRHSLGLAGAATGKKKPGFSAVAYGGHLQAFREKLCRHDVDGREQRQGLQLRQGLHFLDQIDHTGFRPGEAGHLLLHPLSREQAIDIRSTHAGLDTGRPQSEVQVDRHLARQGDRQVGDVAAQSRRKDDADPFLIRPSLYLPGEPP